MITWRLPPTRPREPGRAEQFRPRRTPHDHLAALRHRTGRRRFGNPLLRNGYPAPEHAPHDHLAALRQRTRRCRFGNPLLRNGYLAPNARPMIT